MPGPVDVHVWWAHTDDLTQEHLALLDPVERERWSRYRRPDDRARFALGSALVRGLVAMLDGTTAAAVELDRTCPRCGAQHGPVTTPGRGWRCSVAHSGAFAVAAVVSAAEAGEVGVDVETRCPPEWADLLPDVVAPGEPDPDDEAAFLTLWVRKEAVAKATRTGLSRPLSSFALTDVALRVADLDVAPLRQAGGTTVAAALAVDAPDADVRWQRAPR